MPVSIVEIDAVEYGVVGDCVGILSVLEFRVGSYFDAKLLPFHFVLHTKQEGVGLGSTWSDGGHDGKLLRKPILFEFRENVGRRQQDLGVGVDSVS